MSVTRSDLSKLIDQISQIDSVKSIEYVIEPALTFILTSDYKKIWQLRRYIHLNCPDHTCIVGAGSRNVAQTKSLKHIDHSMRAGAEPDIKHEDMLPENFDYTVLFSVYNNKQFSEMSDSQLRTNFEEYNTQSSTYLDFLNFVHKTRKFDINPQYTNVKHHECQPVGSQDWDNANFIERIESIKSLSTIASKLKTIKGGDSIIIDGDIGIYANRFQVVEALKKIDFDVRYNAVESGVPTPRICLRGTGSRQYDDIEFEIVLQGAELQNFLDRVFKAVF